MREAPPKPTKRSGSHKDLLSSIQKQWLSAPFAAELAAGRRTIAVRHRSRGRREAPGVARRGARPTLGHESVRPVRLGGLAHAAQRPRQLQRSHAHSSSDDRRRERSLGAGDSDPSTEPIRQFAGFLLSAGASGPRRSDRPAPRASTGEVGGTRAQRASASGPDSCGDDLGERLGCGLEAPRLRRVVKERHRCLGRRDRGEHGAARDRRPDPQHD